ncbi:IS3 family transposase [Streptomyces sp. Wh19]|uniref:IS3 family transposase n=1 Tax=Streptomyces sp. Wh19 TaxID=3076629 RepID=UPI003FA3C023
MRGERTIGHIHRIHAASGRTYGARRTHPQSRRKDLAAARRAIERLMREDGPEGAVRGQRHRTTIPEPSDPGRRARSTDASPPTVAISCGSPTSPISARGRAGATSSSSRTCIHGDRRAAARHPRAHRSPPGRPGDGFLSAWNQEGLGSDSSQRPRLTTRTQSATANGCRRPARPRPSAPSRTATKAT